MGNKFSAVNGVRSSNFYEPGNGVNEIWVGDLEIVSRLPFGDSDMAQAGWPKGDYPKIPWRPFIIPLKGTVERAADTVSTSISELSRRTDIGEHVAGIPLCLSHDRLDWIVLKLLSIPFSRRLFLYTLSLTGLIHSWLISPEKPTANQDTGVILETYYIVDSVFRYSATLLGWVLRWSKWSLQERGESQSPILIVWPQSSFGYYSHLPC